MVNHLNVLLLASAALSAPLGPQNSTIITRDAAKPQVCIKFTADNPDWYFRKDWPWGDGKTIEQFKNLPQGYMCVPQSKDHQGGGAVFISPNPSVGPGSTKMECYFPEHADLSNCDMSLVDGYSLSTSCKATNPDGGSISFGGSADLYSQGNNCPFPALEQGMCRNHPKAGIFKKDGGVPQAELSPFFQRATLGPEEFYCIDAACRQNPYFSKKAEMECHVHANKHFPTKKQ